MNLSTKNIDKAIRTIKRSLAGLPGNTRVKCFACGKKMKKSISILNGLGSFNNYHLKCFAQKLLTQDK